MVLNRKPGVVARNNLIFAALALFFLSTAAAAAGEYYKWEDDEGVTHYSAEKPEDREASRVEGHNPPSSSQDQAMERLEKQRQEARQEGETAADEEQDKDTAQAPDEERCKKHRENLQTLNTTTQVRRKNPETGELETLTEEERQAMIKKTKKALERCNQKQDE
jgi:hypothetical protein